MGFVVGKDDFEFIIQFVTVVKNIVIYPGRQFIRLYLRLLEKQSLKCVPTTASDL